MTKAFEEFVKIYEPNIPRTKEISLVDIGNAMRATWQASAKIHTEDTYESIVKEDGFVEIATVKLAYQEGVEQGRHEYVSMDQHTRETIIEGAITDERKRVVLILRNEGNQNLCESCADLGFYLHGLADRIEQEDK